MIRFKLSGPVPKTVYRDSVFGIMTRGTFYGVHRSVPRLDVDSECSKSTLLFFTDARQAQKFVKRLQRSPGLNSRIYRAGALESAAAAATAVAPANPRLSAADIQAIRFTDAEQMCLLRYMDMFLAFHTEENLEKECLTLECYTYHCPDWPNRPLMNKMMEDLLR